MVKNLLRRIHEFLKAISKEIKNSSRLLKVAQGQEDLNFKVQFRMPSNYK